MNYLALYKENERLQQVIGELKDELFEERERHNQTMGLLMQGEAFRSKLMLDAILGKFSPDKLTTRHG